MTVTAYDRPVGGLSISQSFTVTVDPTPPTNTRPEAAIQIINQTLRVDGGSTTIGLSDKSSDPDRDPLRYTAPLVESRRCDRERERQQLDGRAGRGRRCDGDGLRPACGRSECVSELYVTVGMVPPIPTTITGGPYSVRYAERH